MPSVKPSLLLIQGSFQLPDIYQDLVRQLEASGYEVICPTLPSISDHDNPDFPTRTILHDAAVVEAALTRLVGENKTVVVVMHSYGGLVGSQAIPQSLTYHHRQAAGQPGGVLGAVFYAAFLLGKGQSVLGTWGESSTNDLLDNGRYIMKGTRQALFGDLTDDEAEKWSTFVVPQSHAVESTVLTRAAYEYLPSGYIVCSQDQTCPPMFQQAFAKQAGSRVVEMSCGHSPHLSHVKELAENIDMLVDSLAEK